jgi:hypothetical protein
MLLRAPVIGGSATWFEELIKLFFRHEVDPGIILAP